MTAKKLARASAMREADFAGISAPAEYRSAALAWDRLQNRITPSLAAELNLSRQTLEDMGNPGRRKRGPHLLLAQAIELALEFKPAPHQRADVFAPLDWLEAKFGRLVVDAPESSAHKSPAAQAKSIARLLVEFAEFVDAVDDPNEIDDASRLRARQQLQDVVQGGLELLAAFEVGHEIARGAVPQIPTRKAS